MNPISQILDKLARKLDEMLTEDPKKGPGRVEKNLRAAAKKTFQRMDLITRKEFDVKCEMLTQSQLRIKELERRIGELEGKDTKTKGQDEKT
ncbi:MAG: accessory factor UbiK family protein [Gammaproteobacteria bacterium]|nr:accessory factor UbiK family protein [Gammaproteobacteria bacterium]MDE0411153.1 accessory factor UbiK family protein [Gammaproteobacteria bacterium]